MTTTATLIALNAELNLAWESYVFDISRANQDPAAILAASRNVSRIRAAITEAIAKGIAFRKSMSDMRKSASLAR